jgi:chemotaxis protein methyltransferase CheR
LIESEVGIFLGPTKKDLLVARLSRRLRELGLASFSAYWDHLTHAGDGAERTRMIDCICTNETHFFREPAHFAFLDQRVFPEFASRAARGARPRSIRVWSAGCSTGEEPYSVAMALLKRFPPGSGWSISVVASDVSSSALERAKLASYSTERAAEIPEDMARLFTLSDRRAPGFAAVTLSQQVKSLVEFVRVNLSDGAYPGIGQFDLVFCRNVMIYFHPDNRRRVVDRLLSHVKLDGYIFLGHAESLLGMTDRVRCVGPTVYVNSGAERRYQGAR